MQIIPLLLLLAGAAMHAAPEEAEAGGLELEHEDSAQQHRQYFEDLHGPAPVDALIRAQQAIQRERDKVGPSSQTLMRGAQSVPGNAWVNLGPTGSSRDM